MSKYARFISIVTLLALVLGACNLPGSGDEPESAEAVLTAAAQTVEANLTQAALANPNPTATTAVLPTNTTAAPDITLAVPTNTLPVVVAATATQGCDKGDFVTDVTIPDGTVLNPNESFTKTWRIKNTGSCSWTSSYAIVFSSGDAMNGPSTQSLAGNVNAGETVDISVNLKAPSTAGSYRGYWKLRNATGVLFATVYVDIKVGADDDDAAFAVTGVTLSVTGGCGNFQIKANITTNNAGTVTYKWVQSDGVADTTVHPDLVFDSAGTKSVDTSWSTNTAGDKWMDIYIDKPNHQQFGRANFSCP